MWPASEISASELASNPKTSSTTMNAATSANVTASRQR
jgi:hypothetical protein